MAAHQVIAEDVNHSALADRDIDQGELEGKRLLKPVQTIGQPQLTINLIDVDRLIDAHSFYRLGKLSSRFVVKLRGNSCWRDLDALRVDVSKFHLVTPTRAL
jgi:hypothetical protein